MTDNTTGLRIKAYVERIETLSAEKQAVSEDIKEVYAELKGSGFDVKAIREIVKLRKIDRDTRAEQEAILDMYLTAIGEK